MTPAFWQAASSRSSKRREEEEEEEEEGVSCGIRNPTAPEADLGPFRAGASSPDLGHNLCDPFDAKLLRVRRLFRALRAERVLDVVVVVVDPLHDVRGGARGHTSTPDASLQQSDRRRRGGGGGSGGRRRRRLPKPKGRGRPS
jgi:hypothetical protein